MSAATPVIFLHVYMWHGQRNFTILGAFAKLSKEIISFVMPICLSLCLSICSSVCLSPQHEFL
jgi:hypothetical protein